MNYQSTLNLNSFTKLYSNLFPPPFEQQSKNMRKNVKEEILPWSPCFLCSLGCGGKLHSRKPISLGIIFFREKKITATKDVETSCCSVRWLFLRLLCVHNHSKVKRAKFQNTCYFAFCTETVVLYCLFWTTLLHWLYFNLRYLYLCLSVSPHSSPSSTPRLS